MAKLNSSRIYGTLIVDSTITGNGSGLTSLNATNISSGTLSVARGGTGQTTLALARNAMGLGNTTGALPVANGGTGAADASTARTNLGLGNVTNESKATMFTSPALTGTPTAPTAAAATNTTQIATTAFVQTAVSGLIDSAPGTLDTLNELAAALGDDPNFATTIATSIGTKVTANTAITAGTATKITYDTKGLVTAGTTLAAGDIPNLDAGKITSGTFADARIPNLNASKITAGTFGVVRGGTGAATLASGEVLIGAGTGAVTTLSRSGIDSRASFPPSSHTHDDRYYTETEVDTLLSGKLGTSGKAADSELLDGIDSASFLRSDANDTATGVIDFTGGSGSVPAVRIKSGGNSWSEGIAIHPLTDNTFALAFFRPSATLTNVTASWGIGNLGNNGTNNFGLLRNGLTGGSGLRADSVFDVTQAGVFRFGFNPTVGSNAIWHAGNDGSGSGLDADLLDGVQAASFLRSDANDSYVGTLTMSSSNTTGSYNTRAIELREVGLVTTGQSADAYAPAIGFHWGGRHGKKLFMPSNGSLSWDGQRVFADDYHPNADALTTARTLTIGSTGKTFNGSGDVSWSLAEIGAQAAGSYAAASHNHDASHITSGTIDVARLPAIAITDTFTGTTLANFVSTVYSIAPTSVQKGDILILTTDNQTYVHNGGTAGTAADFTLLRTPTDLVTSVASKTGAVTLVKADVGLGSVDNTSDANKPVSTAQQTALNLKANLNSPTFTGTVSGITKSMVGLSAVDNTSDANKPVSTATQTALNGKANTSHGHSADVIGVSGISFIGKSTSGGGSTAELSMATAQTMLGLGSAAYVASSTFAASSHTHSIANVTGLQDALNAKLNLTGGTLTGQLNMSGNNLMVFGPNTGWSKYLSIGGNANSGNADTASIGTTNGNLHIDAAAGGFATYLNFYAGTNGTWFGAGNGTTVAVMGPDGDLWKGNNDNTGSKYWHAGNDGSGSGLDADLLDGFHASQSAGSANTAVVRNASGYIMNTWFNSNRGDETSAAASYIYDTGDGYMRKKTLANARTEIVTSAAVTAGLGFTPYNSTNPSGYQTAAQVASSIAALVDAAPGTLDTLNELAAALGDDPNFATTVSNAIGTKQDSLGSGTTGEFLRWSALGLPYWDTVTASDVGAAASSHNHSADNITSGTLIVARGGTGAATHTSGNVLIGAGTNAITSLSRSGIDTRTSFPPASHELSTHSDVSISSPTSGQVLKWNGLAWTNQADNNTTYTLSSFGVTSTAAELNVLDGITATTTELNYTDGVTSNIQTQLNGKAASSHTHAATDITSGTIDIARMPLTLMAGNTSSTFWNPTNGSIAQYSTSVGWFTTTSGLSVTHNARLASTLNTGANTTSVSVFSLTNITPGQYMIMIEGRWGRASSLNARSWQGTLFVNDATNVLLDAVVNFVPIATFTSQTAAHLNAASASAYNTGNNWITTSSATAVSGSPFFVLGRLSIAGTVNKTLNFAFRQSTSDGSNTCSVLAGTSIQLIKVG